MFSKAAKWFFLNAALGTAYLCLSLAIGEVHPFTLVPMYNSFPNWSYAFYLSDEKEQFIPLKEYFRYSAGNFGHHFCAVAEDDHIAYGGRIESDAELNLIGEKMLQKISGQCYKQPEAKQVYLHRLCFYWEGDSIQTEDKIIGVLAASSLKCP